MSDPLVDDVAIVSLFSGYGGLDEGVRQVLGGEVVAFVEFDDAPSRILAHHWPDVPNLGDITAVDWTRFKRGGTGLRGRRFVVMCGGFPCQDVSLAGGRAGLKDGTRSGLWAEFARAIDEVRPDLVVIENVRGLLSAEANWNLELDPWRLGDRGARPTLRALGAVLGDLAEFGYDAEWCGVRASDAGAPHGRFRIFILAYPRGSASGLRSRLHPLGQGAIGERRPEHVAVEVAPDTDDVESERQHGERARRTVAPGCGVAVPNTLGDEPERDGGPRAVGGAAASGDAHGEQRERVRDTARRRGATVADTDRDGLGGVGRLEPGRRDTDGRDRANTAWGPYEPAVRRWEAIIERVAPSPTIPDGRDGGERLSAFFVEWMQGLAAGHVTGVPGITRNAALKILGNGVVPQQAVLALRLLLGRT